MKLDTDNKERLKIAILFLLQSYRVVMGSMLVVFVPRQCDKDICSLSENIQNDDTLNRVALFSNFLSILFFLITYAVELRRENFCVHNFDIDHDVGDNNLAVILKNKPDLLKELHSHNNLYYKITSITFFVYLVNFILSDIVLYDDPTFWKAGLAPYFSYILLILMKLYNCYYISASSIQDDKALSAYMTEFSSFNVIDIDMLEDADKPFQGEKNPGVGVGDISIGLPNVVLNSIL
tara:strand:- start:108 stop:815 length:708 start_codon:yes stop_codon:yes gene_type:complete